MSQQSRRTLYSISCKALKEWPAEIFYLFSSNVAQIWVVVDQWEALIWHFDQSQAAQSHSQDIIWTLSAAGGVEASYWAGPSLVTPPGQVTCSASDWSVTLLSDWSGRPEVGHIIIECVGKKYRRHFRQYFMLPGQIKKHTTGSRNWARHPSKFISVPGLVVGSLLYRLWGR